MSAAPISMRRVDAIDARVAPFDWAFCRERADAIAAHWRGFVAAKPASFDGRVLLMSRAAFAVENARRIMRSEHFETGFSAFMAWRDFGFPGSAARNCFGMAALRGDDGGFILAEMGAHTANAGQIYFPAGTPDLDDVAGGRLDIEGSVRRELEEETGFSPEEVSFDPDWLLVDAGPRLACMKLARVAAPAAEAAREINARIAGQKHPELAGVRVVNGIDDIDEDRMPEFIIAYLRHVFAGE